MYVHQSSTAEQIASQQERVLIGPCVRVVMFKLTESKQFESQFARWVINRLPEFPGLVNSQNFTFHSAFYSTV